MQDHNFIGGSGPGIAIRPGTRSMTTSGNFASTKLLVSLTPEQAVGYSAGFHVAPLFGAALFDADYIVVQTNFPISVNHTKQKIQWFVRADATEGVDYETADAIRVLDQTARGDVEIIERKARGAASRTYTPGPLSKTGEPINHLMLTMYPAWMGE